MPKENNKMQVDIDTLKKQNVNDLLSIKELYSKLEEVGEKITQIKHIDNTLVKKLKKEYEKLKKIILDENVQIKISNDIKTINSKQVKLTNDIETINSHLDNMENEKATKNEVDIERKRIDIFTKLEEGSTTGDAELIDGRVGIDGNVYSNIGNSIRGQIKPYNDSIDVVRNILPKMIVGYYWNQTDPPTKVESSGHKYAEPIVVVGGEYYCMNNNVSGGTFSFFTDSNNAPICTIESCRDMKFSGYVYKVPLNAKYMYITGVPQGADRVVIKGTYNITPTGLKLNSDTFPYNSILELKIKNDVYLKSGKNIEDYLQRHEDKIDYLENKQKITYNKITDEVDQSRLIVSNKNLSQLQSIITTNGNVTKVTVTKQYSGACVYPFFTTNSDTVMIKAKGSTINVQTLDVLIQYKTSTNITKSLPSIPLEILENGEFNINLSFDAANLIVYQDAIDFSVLVRVTDSSPNGSFTLTDFKIYNSSVFEKNPMYDKDFTAMMTKVFAKIEEEKSTSVKEIETLKISPNGKKYVLQINNNGNVISIPTIPNKTLFMGNSLVFGMGYGEPSWGMCASQSSKDFRNIVQAKILEKNPSAIFKRVHGAQLEQLETNDVNALWNTTLNSYTNQPLKNSFTSDLDLIIIQLGDNVSTENRALKFKDNIIEFLKLVRNACPNARILWIDGWFNYNKSHKSIINACEKYGIKNIDIHTLNTIENQGYEGQLYLGSDGTWKTVQTSWITHPGDKGFQKIADIILENINM